MLTLCTYLEFQIQLVITNLRNTLQGDQIDSHQLMPAAFHQYSMVDLPVHPNQMDASDNYHGDALETEHHSSFVHTMENGTQMAFWMNVSTYVRYYKFAIIYELLC